jgi:molybdopterin converting factor small subunit
VVAAKVQFFGPVRGLVRKKEQRVVLDDGATLRRLLEELGRTNGPEFRRYIVHEGKTLNPVLLVALNGESVDQIANLDVVLPQGAIVDVLLAVPIMGG